MAESSGTIVDGLLTSSDFLFKPEGTAPHGRVTFILEDAHKEQTQDAHDILRAQCLGPYWMYFHRHRPQVNFDNIQHKLATLLYYKNLSQ